MTDIRRARMMAKAIAYYAQELRAVPDNVPHTNIAGTVERMANAVLAALDEADDAIVLDMVGSYDE